MNESLTFLEGDSKTDNNGKDNLITEQSFKIDRLGIGKKLEGQDKDDSLLANEQLIIQVNKEIETNKTLSEDLSKAKGNFDAHIQKLKQEIDKKSITNDTLQLSYEKLRKEFDAMNLTNISLQANNHTLKQQLDEERIANRSHQVTSRKIKQQLDKEVID